MKQWLTGTTGTEKIALLNKRFESVCLDRINNKKDNDYPVYTPFMSLNEGRERLPSLLLEKKSLLVKDNEYLNHISDFYTPPANNYLGDKNTVEFGFDQSKEEVFDLALNFFCSNKSFVVDVFKSIVKNIIPMRTIESEVRKEGVGNSNRESIGALYLSAPSAEPKHLQLAINIAHEVGHQALMLYQTSDSIIHPAELTRNVYSAVRRTDRPAIQSFHALVAVVYMRDFVASIDLSKLNESEKDFIRTQHIQFISWLKANIWDFKKITFTEVGKMIYDELFDYIESI
ncbi:MAG: hypothetical protein CL677_00700 [Bdellovibrionaceae bacterium]|nr:hypothetical protein [Pseudobdellovibrionaceae bacterium]|tara:strand:+ start:108047 stop:108907 length:861 start_codon:yes stop_codon:yes gene_type:complete